MIKITMSSLIFSLLLLVSFHFHLTEARNRPPLLRRPYITTHAGPFQDERSKQIFSECTEHYRSSKIDHFSWANQDTYKQRYFVCDKHYNPSKEGVIFFYLGNEADVTLYLNNTGLMHELAPRHNALSIFAEHRYYGVSKPFPPEAEHENMGYLTTEQAMADYAALIWDLKADLDDQNIPVVGFGGSYGGMLATWFRLKYPHLMDGAIAASAPIWSFFGEDPPYDSGGFNEAVTWDASEEGGSAPACVENARKAWKTMFEWGKSKRGRRKIAESMRLCKKKVEPSGFEAIKSMKKTRKDSFFKVEKDAAEDKGEGEEEVLKSEEDVEALAAWGEEAWAYLAMGDYPYASGYILNGEAVLPAYPVRVACDFLADEDLEGKALLGAMASAVGTFYNATGAIDCFDFDSKSSAGNATEQDATFWDFQFCSEQFMPQTSDGIRDMFWDSGKFDFKEESQRCEDTWGVRPSKYKATIEWGGKRLETASNIVFSNGGRDPWRSGGVLRSLSNTLVAITIPEGAHHLDLMFSNDEDPDSVVEARILEEKYIARWIKEARDRSAVKAGQIVVAVGEGEEEKVLPSVDLETSLGVSLSVA
jgi:lysosomal Pro-X carboxypeptidase